MPRSTPRCQWRCGHDFGLPCRLGPGPEWVLGGVLRCACPSLPAANDSSSCERELEEIRSRFLGQAHEIMKLRKQMLPR